MIRETSSRNGWMVTTAAVRTEVHLLSWAMAGRDTYKVATWLPLLHMPRLSASRKICRWCSSVSIRHHSSHIPKPYSILCRRVELSGECGMDWGRIRRGNLSHQARNRFPWTQQRPQGSSFSDRRGSFAKSLPRSRLVWRSIQEPVHVHWSGAPKNVWCNLGTKEKTEGFRQRARCRWGNSWNPGWYMAGQVRR